ncbi:hypothetical protein ACFC1I_08225 [Microbacterium sp. NPDC056044]|uniref:hypothetical protein n=1 Tax=Microbacterium sp. NPDC056044 TaxID=3345690 RepID=UPI0035D5FA31
MSDHRSSVPRAAEPASRARDTRIHPRGLNQGAANIGAVGNGEHASNITHHGSRVGLVRSEPNVPARCSQADARLQLPRKSRGV